MLQLILAALLSAQAAYPEMIPVQETAVVGRAAPGVSLQTLQGEDFSLEAARGEVVVFAFWASWCGPCRREMPALKQLQANLTDKPVQIVLINVDKDARDARRFLQQIGMTETDLKVIMDNEARVMGEYGVMSMPTTVLIDKNGTVKFSKVGYSTEKGLAELETAIAEALR
ncbi:MAG: TlpA disulfide reductase family protein [Myxococcota bacterium]